MRYSTKAFKLFLVGLILLLMFTASLSRETSAQDTSFQKPFYVLTKNMTTQVSTVWNIKPDSGGITPVFSLAAVSASSPDMAFSQHEKTVVQAAVDGSIIPADWMSSQNIMRQTIQGVWQITAKRLLLQTATEFCEPISHSVCFGYFEFLILNTDNPSNLQSILKVDYHDSILESWPRCNVNSDTVYFNQILLNPKESYFALTLKAAKDCYGGGKSQTRIVDFTHLPVTVTELPNAEGLSWSPDGRRLAYYVNENCSGCPVSINVYSLDNSNTTTLKTYTAIPAPVMPITGWENDTTLFYQWVKLNLDNFDTVLISHDLVSGDEVETIIGPSHQTEYDGGNTRPSHVDLASLLPPEELITYVNGGSE